jgi:hypothetical protein
MNIVFDCNVFDRLASAKAVLDSLKEKIIRSELTVIVTRRLWKEICASPHKDLAASLQLKHVGESVMFAGGRVGDRVGSGRLYHEHLGTSRKFGDALIADAADCDADLLVSEDNRLRKRMNDHAVRCRSVSFDEFAHLVLQERNGA